MIQIWLIVFVLLVISTYTDCKNGTIPIWLYIVTPICTTIWYQYHFNEFDYMSSTLGFFILGSIYLVAVFWGGGGGDVIMMASLGWMLGIKAGLYIALMASFIYLIAILYMRIIKKNKDKKLTLPYAPFVTASSSVIFTIGLIQILI